MAETINPCANCKTCRLVPIFSAIGADYDARIISKQAASEMVSSESQKAGKAGCSASVIGELRRSLRRINSNLGQENGRFFVHSPATRTEPHKNEFGLFAYKKRYEATRKPGTLR